MKTSLYESHCALGAKLTDFGGWEMPLHYKGALHEQRAVRSAVGLFDVSHMGRIIVSGPDAEKLLDLLSTNRIAGKPDFSATYTAWCLPTGGCVDDLIIYRYNAEHFFIIVNAGNRQKDHNHLMHYARGYNVRIETRFDQDGILALQGPKADAVMGLIFPEALNLKPMHFLELPHNTEKVIISSTGYTGAGGYEVYAPKYLINSLWEQFLSLGRPFGIEPSGLGARDILRLEMGYALYGHEIDASIAPTESVMSWAVKLNKSDFIGKGALEELENSPEKRCEQGLALIDPGIMREGAVVSKEGQPIGRVTSGGHSPTLNKSIAIALLNEKQPLGSIVEVAIRQNQCKAEVVALPFIKKDKGQ